MIFTSVNICVVQKCTTNSSFFRHEKKEVPGNCEIGHAVKAHKNLNKQDRTYGMLTFSISTGISQRTHGCYALLQDPFGDNKQGTCAMSYVERVPSNLTLQHY